MALQLSRAYQAKIVLRSFSYLLDCCHRKSFDWCYALTLRHSLYSGVKMYVNHNKRGEINVGRSIRWCVSSQRTGGRMHHPKFEGATEFFIARNCRCHRLLAPSVRHPSAQGQMASHRSLCRPLVIELSDLIFYLPRAASSGVFSFRSTPTVVFFSNIFAIPRFCVTMFFCSQPLPGASKIRREDEAFAFC